MLQSGYIVLSRLDSPNNTFNVVYVFLQWSLVASKENKLYFVRLMLHNTSGVILPFGAR